LKQRPSSFHGDPGAAISWSGLSGHLLFTPMLRYALSARRPKFPFYIHAEHRGSFRLFFPSHLTPPFVTIRKIPVVCPPLPTSPPPETLPSPGITVAVPSSSGLFPSLILIPNSGAHGIPRSPSFFGVVELFEITDFFPWVISFPPLISGFRRIAILAELHVSPLSPKTICFFFPPPLKPWSICCVYHFFITPQGWGRWS